MFNNEVNDFDLKDIFDPPGGVIEVEVLRIPFAGPEDHCSNAPFSAHDIKEVLGSWVDCPDGWDADFGVLAQLNDGRYCYVEAWHDASGWG